MKVLSRDFTLKEKILLIFLSLVLLVLGYYFFVDQPVRSGIASANADYEMYSTELTVLQAKIAQLDAMQRELDSLADDNTRMPSYNANRQEIDFLNAILAGTQNYTINFSNVTRNGDQIRRSFTLQFTVDSYDEARNRLAALGGSQLRCKLGDLYYSSSTANNRDGEAAQRVSVGVSAVFYETMVGGTPDGALPSDSSAANTG